MVNRRVLVNRIRYRVHLWSRGSLSFVIVPKDSSTCYELPDWLADAAEWSFFPWTHWTQYESHTWLRNHLKTAQRNTSEIRQVYVVTICFSGFRHFIYLFYILSFFFCIFFRLFKAFLTAGEWGEMERKRGMTCRKALQHHSVFCVQCPRLETDFGLSNSYTFYI